MQALKDIYTNPTILNQLAEDLKIVYPKLHEKDFKSFILNDLENNELKKRIERVAEACHKFLPKEYSKALEILYRFCEGKENKFIYLFLPAFVAKYGQHDYQRSMKALRDFTQYSSSEEGVRPFIELDFDRTCQYMLKWTRSKNEHIRRLASEGSRPYLPWARKISRLINDPTYTWPILEALKEDEAKYVQKSVANHINDISKSHPDWLMIKLKTWNLKHPVTEWIIRHGLRTLIKQGNTEAFQLIGYGKKPKIEIKNVCFNSTIKKNHPWKFSFDIVSRSKQRQNLIVDYKIYFMKKNGQQKAKVFKIKTLDLPVRDSVSINQKYTFKDMTTRKHYTGKHGVQLVVNGHALEKYEFDYLG